MNLIVLKDVNYKNISCYSRAKLIREYCYNQTMTIFNIILNLLVAGGVCFIFNTNIIFIALSYILFDFLMTFVSDFFIKANARVSLTGIVNPKEIDNVIEDIENMFEKTPNVELWINTLKDCKNKLIKENEIKELAEKENILKTIHKDETNVLNAIKEFETIYDGLIKKTEYNKKNKNFHNDVFKPCMDACSLLKTKILEGLVLKNSFCNQFITYINEFSQNMKIWYSFTKEQVQENFEETNEATQMFLNWTKINIKNFEDNATSDLKVSVKTLTSMMKEDIQNVNSENTENMEA